MTSPAAFLQIRGKVLASQRGGWVAQALLALRIVRIQDEKPGLAILVEQIRAPG